MILQYILLFYVHESLMMYTHTHEGTQPKKKNNKLKMVCSELPSILSLASQKIFVPKLFRSCSIPLSYQKIFRRPQAITY